MAVRGWVVRNVAGAVAALSLAGTAQAADLTVQVKDLAGHPAPDAVVMVHAARQPAGPIRFGWPMVMAQHDIAFEPHLLIVPLGADVMFPNLDKVRHHVYSFSPAKRFELKLYGREEARSVRFDKTGPVALGCNIHDRMSGFIYVVDTPYVAKTGANGTAVIHGLPPGAATLTVWQPYMKAAGNKLDRPITIAGASSQTVAADIRPSPMAMK